MSAPSIPGFEIDEPPPAPLQRPSIPKPDNNTTVILRGIQVALNSDIGGAFVADCCRNRERIFSDDRLREKYEIGSDADWTEIINNKALRLAIAAESERRMLNGTAAQESAAKIFTEAPEVLGSILRDQKANPRHRIEASKELRTTARVGDEKAGDIPDRVIVTINLGNAPEDKLVFDCGPPRQTTEAPDAETERW